MLRVGITGQSGFIGTHLYNTLGLYPDRFERIYFEDSFFSNIELLEEFVSKCDTIVHLAALNRHNDPQVIYETNIKLVESLIDACEKASVIPHIIFSSSTQEERDNLYGSSKREGRKLFENWAAKYHAHFTGVIIPNVFGAFGNPFHNSVVATFCYQLLHNETPKIEVDAELKLIYVNELVVELVKIIESHAERESTVVSEKICIPYTQLIKVTELLQKLTDFKENYFLNGSVPDLENTFNLNLFNTFITFIDHQSFYPFLLKPNIDNRGSFVEIIKLKSGGQLSFSTTKQGITRGNHFHTRKAERFTVIQGKAIIELRRKGTNKKLIFKLSGETPSFVDMPIWYTHNIKNVGEEDLVTIFWINEPFNQSDPDTFFELV
jgi:UDP-2-acetamido-2,6-beta-L-arabino-hexul-4-ose reductase